jgi:hypothetical protein
MAEHYPKKVVEASIWYPLKALTLLAHRKKQQLMRLPPQHKEKSGNGY